jgi:hypothetical protein
MPMFFWLPAIIVSGWWSVLAAEARREVARQSVAACAPIGDSIDIDRCRSQ